MSSLFFIKKEIFMKSFKALLVALTLFSAVALPSCCKKKGTSCKTKKEKVRKPKKEKKAKKDKKNKSCK